MKELNANINLVICQKNMIDSWLEHFQTYYPEYNIIVYNKPVAIPDHSVIIINYDLVWRRPELGKLKNFTLMLDEASCIKNEAADRSKFILSLNPENVILLSGTPTGGKYEELWSQLRLLGWEISKDLFYKQFMITEKREVAGITIKTFIGYKNVDRLKDKLREHGAIFMKTAEVMQLPEQMENIITVTTTKEYARFRKDRIIEIDGTTLVGDTSLTRLLYLRQLAGMYNRNKLSFLRELLESTEDRVVIFYNFKREYELIKNICTQLNKPVSTISGDLKNLSEYEKTDNTVTLVQYQAGAMGVNLQKAHITIYYTLPLSADLWMQSLKRTHRIGQQHPCFYYYLLTDKSIEFQIMDTLKKRQDFTLELFEEESYD